MSEQFAYLNHSKWQQEQQTTQTVMYRASSQVGWPSGPRYQTQENFSLEISGTRTCAWVQIPLLSDVFNH